jgi:phage shock protein PspC (stress-responsive transcriptional regulator)
VLRRKTPPPTRAPQEIENQLVTKEIMMSQRSWNMDNGPVLGMYRDRDNAWVFGVCAGLADRFNFRLGTVRAIAIICLLLFFWLTAAIYIGATLLFREKPLVYSGRESEYQFWRRSNHDYWSRS